VIKLGNLHPTSLYDEPRLWWLSFLLQHHVLWLCFRDAIYPSMWFKSRQSRGKHSVSS